MSHENFLFVRGIINYPFLEEDLLLIGGGGGGGDRLLTQAHRLWSFLPTCPPAEI